MMCEEKKFFVCKHCGNLVGIIHNSKVPMICCGEPMAELVPNSTDAAAEKHVPVVEVKENLVTVCVGSVPHPMTKEHHITWIFLKTLDGGQRKCLDPEGEAKAEFALTDGDKAVAAYAYCNLHGLWKADI